MWSGVLLSLLGSAVNLAVRGAAVVRETQVVALLANTIQTLVEATRKGMTVERVEMNGGAAASTEST